HHGRGLIMGGTTNGNLELAGQEREFWMESGPLTDDFTPGTAVLDFIWCNAGKLVSGRVTDTVTTGLNGMQIDLGQLFQNVRYLLKLGPVNLDILPRGKVAIAFIII